MSRPSLAGPCPAFVLIVLWVSTALAAAEPPAPVPAALEAAGAATVERAGQDAPLSALAYQPISWRARAAWTAEGIAGPRSLFVVGGMGASWQTAWNSPDEWGQSWSGFGKRYLQREADVAISSALEAGLGGLWGEDPRYIPSGRRGIWPRARYAMKTVFLAQRRDGHLAFAWGRLAGNTVNNFIENTWLPPSGTTARSTTVRITQGFLGRLAGNAWEEFWPDARRLLVRRKDRPGPAVPDSGRTASRIDP